MTKTHRPDRDDEPREPPRPGATPPAQDDPSTIDPPAEDEQVDQESEESFPASDPPANY
ncbi:MAG: hypothetical protein JHD16_09535 [Solirubrobacteraceae bacterium]|nr:hypothetical protein [Solirubrobacteraceae bacterium]